MIISSNDILISCDAEVFTSVVIAGTSIGITIKSQSVSDKNLAAISFLSGDMASGNPLTVTLGKSAIDKEKKGWDIDTINAYQMMRLAHAISGEGEGRYMGIIEALYSGSAKDQIAILSPLGDSDYSRYLVKGLYIFSINSSALCAEQREKTEKVRSDFEKEAFTLENNSKERRALIAKIRALPNRSKHNV